MQTLFQNIITYFFTERTFDVKIFTERTFDAKKITERTCDAKFLTEPNASTTIQSSNANLNFYHYYFVKLILQTFTF